MRRFRISLCFVAWTVVGLGCQDHDETGASSEPAAVLKTTEVADQKRAELPAALSSLYKKLNMRSFESSFGPRLKYHCESYLFEYFPDDGLRVDSPTQMTLVNGDDRWVVEILSESTIRVENAISGPGSYYSSDELVVQSVKAVNDIRASGAWIEQRPDCKPLNPESKTVLGLSDHRSETSTSAWTCGDFWGGRDVTAELEYWKGLNELIGKSNPARHDWGPLDMLMIDVRDPAALSKQCSSNNQLRDVRQVPVFDAPEGRRSGTLTRIATFAHGLLDMVGSVSLDNQTSHRVFFDTMRKEQVVLLFSQRRGDWIDISPSATANTWINVQSFDPNTYSVRYLPHVQRVASADEINLLTASPRTVHAQASSRSAVVFTLSDIRTAMTPIAIEGDWMHVKFVPPPDYPLIGCGDEPQDYTWVSGWIQWRDGAEWVVTEEHHYGC